MVVLNQFDLPSADLKLLAFTAPKLYFLLTLCLEQRIS